MEENRQQQPDGTVAADDMPPETLEQATADQRIPFSRFRARIDVGVAAFFMVGSALLMLIMPDLVAKTTIETQRSFATLTPAIIPEITFGVLACVSAVALFFAVATVKGPLVAAPAEEMDRYKRAVLVAGIAVLYALSVPVFGYVFATMAAALVLAYFLGLRNPLLFIPGGIVLPIAIRFIFERLLLISLPRSSIDGLAAIEDAIMNALVHLFLK